MIDRAGPRRAAAATAAFLLVTLAAACTAPPARTAWAPPAAGRTAGAHVGARQGRPDPGAQFRGDPAHTGAYPDAGLRRLGAVAWSVCTGGAVRSSAAVGGEAAYIGSGDGMLRALDLETGELLWRYDAGAPISSSPAVAGGRVVVSGRDGVTHAVDAGSGRRLWTVSAGPDRPLPWGREGWDYFVASPTVVGDTVLLAGGDGVLRRVRLEDGTALGETPLGTRLRSSPAAARGRAFVGGGDGVVYAVDVASGVVVWRHATEGAALSSADFGYDRRTVQSSPAVAGRRVFVGSRDGRLYALDTDTGERLWAAEYAPSWVVSSPAVARGTVFTGTSDAHRVEALDVATGTVRWSRDVGTRVLGSPTLAGAVLLVPGNDGFLSALDAADGSLLWRFAAGAMIQSSPAVAGDLVVFGDDAGHVTALRGGSTTPRLAVFRDSALATFAPRPDADRLADDLARAGYELLDAPGLAAFLSARLEDRVPSVVVFAQDALPPAVAVGDGAAGAESHPDHALRPARPGLLRRYLEAGGKVVWLGVPPRSIVRDSSGRPTAFRPERAGPVTGVDFSGADGSDYGARPTAEGRRWGLRRARLSTFVPESPGDVVALALDDLGRPAAFVRGFGGGPGTGFVYLWGRGYRPDMLAEIRRAAEMGVLVDPDGPPRPIGACPAGVR